MVRFLWEESDSLTPTKNYPTRTSLGSWALKLGSWESIIMFICLYIKSKTFTEIANAGTFAKWYLH